MKTIGIMEATIRRDEVVVAGVEEGIVTPDIRTVDTTNTIVATATRSVRITGRTKNTKASRNTKTEITTKTRITMASQKPPVNTFPSSTKVMSPADVGVKDIMDTDPGADVKVSKPDRGLSKKRPRNLQPSQRSPQSPAVRKLACDE